MGAPKGNQYAKGNKGGHGPTKYRPEFASHAALACKAGLTDFEVSQMLGIGETALAEWKVKYKEFGEALKTGKVPADERVVRSLYHRAIGYSYNSEKVVVLKDGEIVRVPIVEHVPPDTTAAIFWLKNRRRNEWRDRHELEHTGKDGGPIQTEASFTIADRIMARLETLKASSGEILDLQPLKALEEK